MSRLRNCSSDETRRRKLAYNKQYKKTHKAQEYLYEKRSRARGFIRHDATKKDLLELQGLIDSRMKQLDAVES